MLNEVTELLMPDFKALIWAVLTGIIVYYFSGWRNSANSLKEKTAQFNYQIKATIMELKSNQRGNRGNQKHPFDIQQLSRLLSLELMARHPKEFEVLTNLKVDMTTLNSGGRVQNSVPGDIRWERTSRSIELLEKLLKE
ncbi:MAG: hypothetical protein K940chlam7_01047 [Chlamydiae bacterium]|nr:hypothetical protein [Chlamydiota bacterium]